jgi:hypothetical protein
MQTSCLFSRNLNASQRHYTTGKKELLSIVETLKEYRTMLFGCRELHVYTDHKNLTFNALQTQYVLRWRLFLEEYGPIFHYTKGSENRVADAALFRKERDRPRQLSRATIRHSMSTKSRLSIFQGDR